MLIGTIQQVSMVWRGTARHWHWFNITVTLNHKDPERDRILDGMIIFFGIMCV